MKGLFYYDGFLSKILTGVMYIVSLNLLFLLCSIPVFTVGAAQTAMYTVLLKYIKHEEPDIIRGFFAAFRENFKRATLVWLVMLAAWGTLAGNYYFLYNRQMELAGAIRILLNLVLIALLVMWAYLFPVMAYFENNIRGYVAFSAGLAVAKLPFTAALVLLRTVPLLAVLFLEQFLPMAVLLLICCGSSLPAYYSGKMLLRLFQGCGGDSQ
ncbi:DUF624 domain-containing protein [Lachnospiraceae bacterium 47-T17]